MQTLHRVIIVGFKRFSTSTSWCHIWMVISHIVLSPSVLLPPSSPHTGYPAAYRRHGPLVVIQLSLHTRNNEDVPFQNMIGMISKKRICWHSLFNTVSLMTIQDQNSKVQWFIKYWDIKHVKIGSIFVKCCCVFVGVSTGREEAAIVG